MAILDRHRLDAEDSAAERLRDLIGPLAAWGLRVRGLERLSDILELQGDPTSLPRDLAVRLAVLNDLPLGEFAAPHLLDASMQELAESLLYRWAEPRDVLIYERRYADGSTLQEVADEFGVTRERVRQLQTKHDAALNARLRRPEFRPIWWRAKELRRQIGVAAPREHPAVDGAINEALEDADHRMSRLLLPLLLRLAGPYVERDGWLICKNPAPPDPAELWGMTDIHGLLPVVEAHQWLLERGVSAEFHDSWIDRFGRFRQEGDTLLLWSGNAVDKCVALLALRGEPTDAATLVQLVGEGHNARGIRSRFFEDQRLVRVSLRDWALVDWGLEEYSGLAEEIKQRIEARGGSTPLSPLIAELSGQFGVKENSVRTYAAAPMFVLERGIIRLRRQDEPLLIDDDLSAVQHARRLDGERIEYSVAFDSEAQRGSGRVMPAAVAAALGVTPGHSRSFRFEDSEGDWRVLQVTWPMTSGTGPTLGSVRVIGAAVGAIQGDRLRLEFNVAEGLVCAQRLPPIDATAPEDVQQIVPEVTPVAAPTTLRARPPRRRKSDKA